MNQIEKLADDRNICGEGPVWDEQNSILYWVDNMSDKTYSYDWKSRQHKEILSKWTIGGLILHQEGGFILGGLGLAFWQPGSAPQMLVRGWKDEQFRFNDMSADPAGRVFAGTLYNNPRRLGALYRFDLDGSVHQVETGLGCSNGIGYSPDERIMYFTDTGPREIYKYDYDRKTGEISNRTVFVRVPDDEGYPDGLTVDREGFIWSAQWDGYQVVRYDPDGKVERRIKIPTARVTSIAFGGPEMNDLFITSAAWSGTSPTDLTAETPGGGALFHVRVDIQGRPEYRAKLPISGYKT